MIWAIIYYDYLYHSIIGYTIIIILNIKVVEYQYAEMTIQTTTNKIIRRSIHLDMGKTQTHQH